MTVENSVVLISSASGLITALAALIWACRRRP